MPVKIKQKITYHLDIDITTLQVKSVIDVDDQALRAIYNEIEELYKALAEMIGALPVAVPEHRRHNTSGGVSPIARTKLLEYASKQTDFTIKGASEALDIPEPTLYAAASKLVESGDLLKTQVLGGIAHIYTLKKQNQTTQKITVLPKGKLPFPDMNNPEREKMNALRG